MKLLDIQNTGSKIEGKFDQVDFWNTKPLHLASSEFMRFINCEFKDCTFREPKECVIHYVTNNKNTDHPEGAYELFQLLIRSNDAKMIILLQNRLSKTLQQYKGDEHSITTQQDKYCRKIFSYHVYQSLLYFLSPSWRYRDT